MNTKLFPQDVIVEYTKICEQMALTDYGDKKSVLKHNRLAKKLNKILETFKYDTMLSEKILNEIMLSDVDIVASNAAADALRMNILVDKAISVLEKVSKRNDTLGFSCKMALKIRRGEMPS
jgi:hypothetical protein